MIGIRSKVAGLMIRYDWKSQFGKEHRRKMAKGLHVMLTKSDNEDLVFMFFV